jgi:hypothetical protein
MITYRINNDGATPGPRTVRVQKTSAFDPYSYNIDAGVKLIADLLQRAKSRGEVLSVEDAAAIAGNGLYESNLKPFLYQGQSISDTEPKYRPTGGFGLFQWDDRRALLEKMKNFMDYNTQLDYFDQENRTTEKKNYQAVLNAMGLDAKTDTFAKKWERAGKLELPKRRSLAKAAYDAYQKSQQQNQPAMKNTVPDRSLWEQIQDAAINSMSLPEFWNR